jgi:transcriptional regulator with XRE-family HTH domain
MKQRQGLGYKITQARLRSGLTQKEIAERMRTTPTVVARWETGMAVPTVTTLEMLAEVTENRLEIRIVGKQGRKAALTRKAIRRLAKLRELS